MSVDGVSKRLTSWSVKKECQPIINDALNETHGQGRYMMLYPLVQSCSEIVRWSRML